MQGEQVEQSIIQALDRINATRDNWDVVVIIRGEGPLPTFRVLIPTIWRQTVHSSRFLLLPESVTNETIRCWI